MAIITVVEPNTLLRLGILKLLQTLACDVTIREANYSQLFTETPVNPAPDLMLLSVPNVYDHMVELVQAAQKAYAPRRILLLSDTHNLPYSLLNLPSNLAGYISKYSSRQVIVTSVTLVLAGGKCFPPPDIQPGQAGADAAEGANATPRRRWYDKAEESLPRPLDEDAGADDVVEPTVTVSHRPAAPRPVPRSPAAMPQARTPTPLSAELITAEAEALNLTPRQYEVLALLAQGHPLKRISRELGISVATIKTHTEALYQRLSVNSRNAAVYAAVSKGVTLGWYDASSEAPKSPPPP